MVCAYIAVSAADGLSGHLQPLVNNVTDRPSVLKKGEAMNGRVVRAIASFLFSVIIIQTAQAAHPDRRALTVEPSISVDAVDGPGKDEESIMSFGFLCHSYRTGIPRNCKLLNFELDTVEETVNNMILISDCQIDGFGDVVPGTCANGGHKHMRNTAERPRTRIFGSNQVLIDQDPLNQAIVEFTSLDEADAPFERFVVRGELPAERWSFISYPAPDNAGSFYYKMVVEPPPCFFLPFLCGFKGPGAQDNGTYLADGTVNVRFDGLSQLPTDTSLYEKVRGVEIDDPPDSDDFRHLNAVAFAGTPRTLVAMRVLAIQYTLATKKVLRPNDISLPYGGLFDIKGEYKYKPALEPFGHRSHRDGQDIDLNRTVTVPNGPDETPNCEDDIELHEAVHKVLAPVPGREPRHGVLIVNLQGQGGPTIIKKTALLCEETFTGSNVFKNKHVDVTQLKNIPPFLP